MFTVHGDGDCLCFCAENQVWDDNDLKRMADKYHVVYNGGVFVIRVDLRKTGSCLYQLGMENDGYLCFGDASIKGIVFDKLWADDLKDVLDLAKKHVEDMMSGC